MSSIGPKQMCLTCKKYKSTTSFFCGLVDTEEDFLALIKDKKLECELENKEKRGTDFIKL